MSELFTIRRAGADDMNAIELLTPDALSRQMHDEFIIVEQEEKAIGFASWGLAEPGIAKLYKLYVLQTAQGKGLGRGMLDFIYGILRVQGVGKLRLNIDRHDKAQRFFEKLKFRIIGREDIDVGNGRYRNDFIMEAKVPPDEYDDDI